VSTSTNQERERAACSAGVRLTEPPVDPSTTDRRHRRFCAPASRVPGSHGSNVVYKRLRERGYDVFAVNPNADTVEGDPSYHDLRSIPGGVEAIVIGTRPETADETMRECADLGIKHVWMLEAPVEAASPRQQRPTVASTD
jgi:acyl-CoA synthetase (NDP forming)